MDTKKPNARSAARRAMTAVMLWSFCVITVSSEMIDGKFERAFAVGGNALVLDVRTGSGRIAVTAGEPGRVRVTGRIRGYANRWTPDGPGVVADRVRAIEADPPIERTGCRAPCRSPGVLAAPAGRYQLRDHRAAEYSRPRANWVGRPAGGRRHGCGGRGDRLGRNARVGGRRGGNGPSQFRCHCAGRGRRRRGYSNRVGVDSRRRDRCDAARSNRQWPRQRGGSGRWRVKSQHGVR